MVFLKEFYEKHVFEQSQQTTKKHVKLPGRLRFIRPTVSETFLTCTIKTFQKSRENSNFHRNANITEELLCCLVVMHLTDTNTGSDDIL